MSTPAPAPPPGGPAGPPAPAGSAPPAQPGQQPPDYGAEAKAYWDQFNFHCGSKASAPAGRGYAMSPDDMRTRIANFTRVRDEMITSLKDARKMVAVVPAGDDPVAQTAHGRQVPSGQAYVDSLNQRIAYLTELVTKLQQALDSTVGHDQQASTDLNAHGQALPDGAAPPGQPGPAAGSGPSHPSDGDATQHGGGGI